MGKLFSKAKNSHPIYASSGSFIGTGGPPARPDTEAEAVDQVAVLLAAGADPLAGADQDSWPLFIASNEGHSDTALALLPATLAAYASPQEPPGAAGGITWLEPAWQIDLGDVESSTCELLLGVRDGFSGEVGADLFALRLDNGYRAYYEAIATSVADFGGPPLIRGFVPVDKSSPDGHDREAVVRSMESGYLSDASVALDAFEGVAHEAWGTFAELFT